MKKWFLKDPFHAVFIVCAMLLVSNCTAREIYNTWVPSKSVPEKVERELNSANKPPKFITVAVIDSGLKRSIFKQQWNKGICKYGHKDFTGTGLKDSNGHGTNVSGIIHAKARSVPYCQVILKFYAKGRSNEASVKSFMQALAYAIKLKVDVINFSAGGGGYFAKEEALIIKALDQGIIIIAAAGNNGISLDKHSYYPASHDIRVIVVGSRDRLGNKTRSSNFGSIVDLWEVGVKVKGSYGGSFTGTSQATATATGKFIKRLALKRAGKGYE